jgi:hypothetical protein
VVARDVVKGGMNGALQQRGIGLRAVYVNVCTGVFGALMIDRFVRGELWPNLAVTLTPVAVQAGFLVRKLV